MNLKRNNDFDGVTPFYDFMARLMFGKSMFRAQTFFLRNIPLNANVLILGGGTGWLLKELIKINSTCSIWYIESSSKMLEQSKREIASSKQQVYFIKGTESNIPSDILYDIVITNFFLDLFQKESCNEAIRKIKSCLHYEGQWIVTDFENITWWNAFMLKVMYIFFRLASDVEASELPPWDLLLRQNGMAVRRTKYFYGKFIRTSLFAEQTARK
jgi:ubiquinone/menaquinone biosynthesis C-methylase UbiE